MNSKGHLIISLAKSTIRIFSIVIAALSQSWIPMGVGFGVAEVFGIFEELVDKR